MDKKIAYRSVFTGKEGKEVLLDLLDACGFGRNKPTDTIAAMRAIGQEDIALYILKQLRQDELKPEDIVSKDFIDTIF